MTSTCDTCRAPGSCCRGFVLNHPFPGDSWRQDAARALQEVGLDFFTPVRRFYSVKLSCEATVIFDCTRLGADGRCTDYENRPMLCREYEPISDKLCAEWQPTFKGIPVVVRAATSATTA